MPSYPSINKLLNKAPRTSTPGIELLRWCFLQLKREHTSFCRAEYAVLQDKAADRFQSVTSMNYESGWKTLVLFFNGHKIDGFPYDLCPVTTSILEKVPVAGRIAGFNR